MDRLAEIDPIEGSYPRATLELDKFTFDDFPAHLRAEFGIKESGDVEVRPYLRENTRGALGMTFVNCWHIGNQESAAMWKIYGEAESGIAIQSRVSRLKAAFTDYPDYSVMIGSVGYLDYGTQYLAEHKGYLYPCFFKWNSFQYENELRAMIYTGGGNPRDPAKKNTEWDRENGLYARINVDSLVERIFVAPIAPRWFVELLDSVLERLGLNIEIVQSDLASGPLY